MSIASTKYRANLVSVQVSQGDIWEVHTITERYIIEKLIDPGPPPVFDPISGDDAELVLSDTGGPGGAGVIPGIGEPYGGGTAGGWMQTALVRRINWSMDPKGATFQATVEYSTRYFYSDDAKGLTPENEDVTTPTSLAPGVFLPASFTPIFRTRSMKLYRDDPGVTPVDEAVDLTSSDIGGVAKNKDMQVRQVGVRLRMYIDSSSTDIVTLDTTLQAYLGTKNNDDFLGYSPGKLVCEGASLNHLENEFYELVIDYLYDELYHNSQVPQLGTDGRPKMNGSNYADVRWARDARTGVDYNDIWASGALGESYKYQAYKGVWY